MSFEGLFSEFFVSAIFNRVHLESVGVAVHIMVLGEQVADWVECGNDASNHANDQLGIRHFAARQVLEIFRDIVGHLGSTGWSSIFVFYHPIVQLRRHSNDHMVKVRIIVSTFRYIETKGRIIMITSQQIV